MLSQSRDLSKVCTSGGVSIPIPRAAAIRVGNQQPCSSSPATSSSFQVLPSAFQALSPNTSQSSSALGLFADFAGIAAIPSVALQIERSRRALPVLVSQSPALNLRHCCYKTFSPSKIHFTFIGKYSIIYFISFILCNNFFITI